MTNQLLEKAIIESCYEDDVAAFADLIQKRQSYLARIENELFEQPDDPKLKQFRRGQQELLLLKRIASLIIQLTENQNENAANELQIENELLKDIVLKSYDYETMYVNIAVDRIRKLEATEQKLNRYQQHFIQNLNQNLNQEL
jgi:hypothetical protein